MAQVLAKEYECLTCKQPIRISKIDNVPAGQKKKWDKFEMDGVTPHVCRKAEQQHSPPPPTKVGATTRTTDELSKEVAAIRAQLLVLVSRLDRIEAELQTHVS